MEVDPMWEDAEDVGDRLSREPFPKQGIGGFDQCWYPIALSEQLGRSAVISREFLSGRVIVFRGENGAAKVLSAYCAHFGADLAAGAVVGDEIRCPFHHWRYGQDGRCTNIPTGEPIPEAARQFSFPTIEMLGVIWAFNGEEPLYDLPTLGVDENKYAIRVCQLRDQPHDPAVFMCNTLDLQHIKVVHGWRFLDGTDPVATVNDFDVGYDLKAMTPQGTTVAYRLAIFGTNILGYFGTFDGREVRAIYTAAPLPNGHSTSYIITATPRGADQIDTIEAFLDRVTAARENVINEDWPILSRIGHPRSRLFTRSDRQLARFVTYLRKFPRAHPSAEFIT
jgi:phenylpropionate dioxygenase-like ring-hydroxylating dioxygenase large terminal subunit